MTTDDLLAGDEATCIPVAELAKIAGYTPEYVYIATRRGQLKLQPGRTGVLIREAAAWLKVHSREAKRAARADAIKRLRAAIATDGA